MNYLVSQQRRWKTISGSIPDHRVINRPRQLAHTILFNDYFTENPRFTDEVFRRRFRMGRNLFLCIFNEINAHDDYFLLKRNAAGRLGLSGLQKIIAAFRILAYGVPADATDEYIKIGESTAIESLTRFCRAVIEVFGQQYLRSPNARDAVILLLIGKTRNFPGMLGSLYCMHWKWKNCPTAWAGQYTCRSRSPTIILEIVADYDIWIWHAYFGLSGSNNDINVLDSSHIFLNLAERIAPPAHYVIQGKEYDTGYYVADGPTRFWSKSVVKDIMTTCIILHNMIVEDERDLGAPIQKQFEVPNSEVERVQIDKDARFQQFLGRYRKIGNKEAHIAIRDALIEHLWEEYTNSEN